MYITLNGSHANDPVMVDLETLGTGPNSVIISIGAVKFDPDTGEIGDEFYAVVDQQSCLDLGLEKDPATVEWWSKQSAAAQEAVFNRPGYHIAQVLEIFGSFVNKNTPLWGNGADFDNVIIANAYRKLKQETPWKFWNNRCYRTMKNLFPRVTMMREGTHHNALDDAKFQAKHLIAILQKMRNNSV